MRVLVFLALILGLFGCTKEETPVPLEYDSLEGRRFESLGDLKFRLEVYNGVSYFYLTGFSNVIDKQESYLKDRFFRIGNDYYIKWVYAQGIVRTDKLKQI